MDDIFGPDPAETPETTASSSTKNQAEFDDIFGDTPAAEGGMTGSENALDSSAGVSSAVGGGTDDFDDIFGGDSKPVDAVAEGVPDEDSLQKDSAQNSSSTVGAEDSASGPGTSTATEAEAGVAGGEKEFLDFLYSDESAAEKQPVLRSSAAEAPAAPEVPVSEKPPMKAASIRAGSPDSISPLGEEGSFLEVTPISNSPSTGRGESGSVLPLTSAPPSFMPPRASAAPASTSESEARATSDNLKIHSPVPAASLTAPSFARKEKAEVRRPLPSDPAAALRTLIAPAEQAVATANSDVDDDNSQEEQESAAAKTTTTSKPVAAADDVDYVRRLCAATGGFLPADLRPVVWSLLLGRGEKPFDEGFVKWREDKRQTSSSSSPSADTGAAVSYKLDLRNDCLALARRLNGDEAGENDATGGKATAGSPKDDPEALASDIEEVLTYYCTRRGEAYEPVLCALVGPLFSMGLDPPAVSALLNPLAGSLTLFLGRGLTHAVRDLAWAHAHRRLHDLCTYHDPDLVQHLNRSFPGWEMPLPAASVSRAETSALDQEAAAMVDDLESSLAGFVPRRRASMAGSVAQAEAAAKGSGLREARPPRSDGQGLVEPSLLVAANAGLGSLLPLGRLLPLWDYMLVRHDKHFGFFLLLAALFRRREELLLATGPHLRILLAETLSSSAIAALLVDDGNGEASAKPSNANLVEWCKEAEALDLATPESFRHHLGLIGEIAEAEYETAVRARARNNSESGGGAVAAPAPSDNKAHGALDRAPVVEGAHVADAAGQATAASAEAKEQNSMSLSRMRTMFKTAGDKLAADIKNLKLPRATSDVPDCPEEPLTPTGLSLPQLCLAVSAKELLEGISGRRRGRSLDGGNRAVGAAGGDGGATADGSEEGKRGLFRERERLSFFAVDCRPKQQVDAGRFPTAYHLDPSVMDNPEEMAETIMPVFEPLRGRTHVCLVGSGDGHLRERGLGARDGRQGIGSQKAARDEYSYVNTCALFFMKRGFPYVSVLEGGFVAALELLMDVKAGPHWVESGDAALSTAVVDYNAAACRLCIAQKTGGNGGADASRVVEGGIRFPLSPRLWARMGAADESSHGPPANTRVSLKAEARKDKEGSLLSSPSKSPGTEKASSNHSSASTRSAQGSVAGGAEGGDGSFAGGGSSSPAPAPAAAATTGSSLFKGGGNMFSGMKVNMGGLFNKGSANAANVAEGPGAGKGDGASTSPVAAAQRQQQQQQQQPVADLATKFRTSFGRFGASKEAKKDVAASVGDGAGAAAEEDDSALGSLFRKAQSFKAADVAAAFADLRDGPKLTVNASVAKSGSSSARGSAAGRGQHVVEVEEVFEDGEAGGDDDDDDDGDAEGVFVIGDDTSEASENTDSDFEGFDGEHRPPNTGGARTATDKAVALLEHRLSGQIKGATMVVDDFLKVPGAKVFNVTKHKVTFHDVDAAPEPPSSNVSSSSPSPESEVKEDDGAKSSSPEGEGKTEAPATPEGAPRDAEASASEEGDSGKKEASPQPPQEGEVKKVRVRAVTELDRLVFLSRERILVLACPSGPSSPGLVKSNHHLTELQKMTFMRKDPSLVTLHYMAPDKRPGDGRGDGSPASSPAGGAAAAAAAATMTTKRNVYRFGLDDKEAFIRIIRGALQRFQP